MPSSWERTSRAGPKESISTRVPAFCSSAQFLEDDSEIWDDEGDDDDGEEEEGDKVASFEFVTFEPFVTFDPLASFKVSAEGWGAPMEVEEMNISLKEAQECWKALAS